MLEMPASWDACRGELPTGVEGRNGLQSIKMREGRDLRSPLTSDGDTQNLEFAGLVFALALAQYFLIVLPVLPSGMVMNVLCHCMLEVCDLTFDFDFTGH